MIPVLYLPNAADFSSFGLGVLTDTISCEVTEERNGVFECLLKYPVSGQHYGLITKECIIKAKPNDTAADQVFRIYRITKPLNGIVTIYGQHISYDLANVPVLPFSTESRSPQLILSQLLAGDSLSSLDLYFTVPQGTPLIALRKKKVGINTPDPQATLDVDGSIHMNGVNVHGKMGRVDGSTTDLNNVKTPGYYFAYSASTEKHFPTTTIGMLEVFLPESYFIQQRYTVYDGSRMYIRGNYGGTWSSWHTVSLTAVT